MEFFEVINKRQSIRSFNSLKQIPDGFLEKIVDAARLAPTARNEQPWEFICIKSKSSLEKLSQILDHGKFIKEASTAIVVVSKDTKYYLEDGCAATENILLAAAGLGLGGCWIAGDKKAYAQEVLNFLNIPSGFKLVSILALGYPKQDENKAAKRPLKEIIHYEQF